MSRTKQSHRKMKGGKPPQNVRKHIAAAQKKSQHENQRPLTAEEVVEETRLANEIFAKEKAERKECGNLSSILQDYCLIVAGQGAKGCSRLVVQHVPSGVTLSLTTLAGEEFTAAGATKTEASENMLRWSEVFSFLSVVDTCTY